MIGELLKATFGKKMKKTAKMLKNINILVNFQHITKKFTKKT